MSWDKNDSKQYTAADIQRYLAGNMPAGEMHKLEKAALHDPFLAEAIEGFSKALGNEAQGATDLHKQLHNRIKRRIFDKPAGFAWWKVAAIFLVLAGTGPLIYFIVNKADTSNTIIVKNEVPGRGVEQKSFRADPMTADSASSGINEKTRQKSATVPGKSTDTKREADAQQQSVHEGSTPVPFKAPSFSEDIPARLKTTNARDTLPVTSPIMNQRRMAEAESKTIAVGHTQQANHFIGQVITRENKPVPGATIIVDYRNREMGVETDSNGYFSFSIPDTAARVQISFQGYEPANATLHSSLMANTIELVKQEEAGKGDSLGKKKQLPGVPVNKNLQDAEPLTGWKSFENYIEKNKRRNVSQIKLHGDVVLSFTIDTNGKPTGFTVRKSLSPLTDEEAIRLVKEGPGWKLLHGKPALITISIRF